MKIDTFESINPAVYNALHPLCQKCIKRHMVDKGRKFHINCSPVINDQWNNFDGLVEEFIADGMTEEDATWAAYKIHPLEFVKRVLDLPPFSPVQEELYVCNAKRIVGRAYRRSGKTVGTRAGKALHRALTSKTTIMVVAPYDDQVLEFFGGDNGGLEDILYHAAKANPWILDWVVRPKGLRGDRLFRVKPRYRMEFITGSVIIGKVLHSSNKQRGSSARGMGVVGLRNVEEEVDEDVSGMVILDESDYLEGDDWHTINPIIQQSPDTESIEITTPSGKREACFKHCTESDEHKEIFYPVTMRPDLAAMTPEEREVKLDEIRRTCQSEDEFLREWMADFGLLGNAIFRHEDLVAISAGDWKYTRDAITNVANCPVLPKPEPNVIRTIGVDWNRPQAGVRIYVCEFKTSGEGDPGFYRMVDHMVVSHSQFTQTMAVDAIVCANRIWRPEWIYCDAGAGDMQIEKMKLFGMQARSDPNRGPNHPDGQLPFIVKAIAMQDPVLLKDPAYPNDEKRMRKVAEKALLINFMQSMVQERAVFLPECERLNGALVPVMTAFKVERLSANGTPVYTAENDHDVIAAGLALYAFWKEYHYTQGRTILETAFLMRREKGFTPSLDLMPKFNEGMVRPVLTKPSPGEAGLVPTIQSTGLYEEREDPILRHVSHNGMPVHLGSRPQRNVGYTRRLGGGFSRR